MPDREKVIKDNAVRGLQSAIEISGALVHLRKEHAKAILELLKEQGAVTPYIDIDEAKCPICKVKLTRQELLGDDVLFEDFYDYCPHCGRAVKWE